MSNKKMAGILGSCIALIIAVVAIAILGPRPVTDYSTLLRYLRDSGASVVGKGEVDEGLFDIEGRKVAVNGTSIEVYEYANTEAMESDASCVYPEGCGIDKGSRVMLVDWICIPHFYKAGRIIVFYCGDNDSISSLLGNALGTQFAGFAGM